jgi:hypothetical protein
VTRGVLEKLLEWRAMPPDERAAQTRVAVLHNRSWAWEGL